MRRRALCAIAAGFPIIGACGSDSSDHSTTTGPTGPTTATVAFQSIYAGEAHACGITASGDAYCWGKNDEGQNGTGDTGQGGVDLEPTRVAGSTKFSRLSIPSLTSHGVFAVSS